MADFQRELTTRRHTWSRFIKGAFWAAGVIAIALIVMWIFLV